MYKRQVAPTFILCGVASAVLGIIKLVDYLLHLNIPYVDYIGFQFGNTGTPPYELVCKRSAFAKFIIAPLTAFVNINF